MKFFKKIAINRFLFVLLLNITAFDVFAESGELTISQTFRISHPAYSMENTAQTYRNPWNVDYSRIILHELGITANKTWEVLYHPNFPSSFPNARNSGRGRIWGCVKDSCVTETAGGIGDSITAKLQDFNFDTASGNQSLIDWDNNSKAFPYQFDFSMQWSPYPGETNIIYALCEQNSGVCSGHLYKLVAYNVDTGVLTPIISYNNGSNPSSAAIIGFTRDVTTNALGHKHEIVINLNYDANKMWGASLRIFTDKENNFANPRYCSNAAGCTLTNPVTSTESMVQSCSSKMNWYPFPNDIHASSSLTGEYEFGHYGAYVNEGLGDKCEYDDGVGSPATTHEWLHPSHYVGGTSILNSLGLTHVSALSSDEYSIMGNTTQFPYTTELENAPYIGDSRIYQVIFNRTYADTQPVVQRCETGCFTLNQLMSRSSAGVWWLADGRDVNYHTMPSPTISPDGLRLHFQGTNGKYTRDDKSHCNKGDITNCSYIGNNWEGSGTYVADLTFVSGVKTCTSFTYSEWGECQSNNTQTKTVTSSSPSGCTGGTPESLTQSCTYGSSALTILKTSNTPTLDGNLTEYNNANSITFSPASGGNTVTVKSLWTSEALYLGVNVTDTQLNASATTRDGSVWSEDSIEWFIDTYYDGGGASTPNSAFMRVDDYQGIVSILNTKYDSQGTTSGIPSSSWNGTWQSAVKLSGTANTNTDTDSGYTIEIKIPWTSIGYSTAPSSDALVGMSFAVNDKDSGGTYSKMWLSSAGSNQNASNWQKVSLSGTLATADVVPPAPPGALMIR